MKPVNRDRLFFKVRDGAFSEARKALEGAKIEWKHSSLEQNFLFFAAARVRPGSEQLAKLCVKMGVDLAETDKHQQTPLFYAASRGNATMVTFLLNLGFEPNFQDNIKETPIFYAVRHGHKEITSLLIERGASLDVVSTAGLSPRNMLSDSQPDMLQTTRKRKAADSPDVSCPGASARSLLTKWEWGQDEEEEPQDEKEPVLEKASVDIVAENDEYYVCAAVHNCAKRLRRSEREFAGDHAHLHTGHPWYGELQLKDASSLVGVPLVLTNNRLAAIENLASGKCTNQFTLAAVSASTNTIAGYVFASFTTDVLDIGHCKVDRSHQGKGLGGLLLQAAETNARNKGSDHSTVKLSVLETNEAAIKCYCKAGFKTTETSPSSFPPTACTKIQWLRMEKGGTDVASLTGVGVDDLAGLRNLQTAAGALDESWK
ncbi:unnamed protein product [Symbiodinium sp. CCMP2592]|nr:unnamed protein product [Symbiodinium sp. CCMP2592]